MIDLDELDKMLDDIALHYSPAFAGELKKAIQELRLAREVVTKAKIFLDAPFDDFKEGIELELALQAYEQHTEGKDASGGTGEQHE